MRNWIIFIFERFKPFEYIPLIFLFCSVNILFSGLSILNTDFIKIFFITLSFFFRMRLFDEIKDYEVDKLINPSRPLPRGLLTLGQVKKMIVILFLFELLIVFTLTQIQWMHYIVAALYSLLMFKEFFMSNFLRPKLTTYAITHTIVVSLLSLVIVVNQEPMRILYFVLSHWFIFNLFEFARKTFSQNEEKKDVLSYSYLFTIRGAYILSLSQVILSFIFLLQIFPLFKIASLFFIMFFYTLTVFIGILKPKFLEPQRFRSLSTAYLGLHYLALFFILWRNG